MFKVNTYKDKKLMDKYKPRKNKDGTNELTAQYESDSEDSYMNETVGITKQIGKAVAKNIPGSCYLVNDVKRSTYKLPTNTLFTMGFHVHTNNDQYCFCPCSKTVMKSWRKGNDIKFQVPHSEVCKDKAMCLEQIIQDLKSKADIGAWLHKACFYYAQFLYSYYWETDLHHKAMYMHPSHPKYTEAKRVQDQKMWFLNTAPIFIDMESILYNEEQKMKANDTTVVGDIESSKVSAKDTLSSVIVNKENQLSILQSTAAGLNEFEVMARL